MRDYFCFGAASTKCHPRLIKAAKEFVHARGLATAAKLTALPNARLENQRPYNLPHALKYTEIMWMSALKGGFEVCWELPKKEKA
jgi:hypothetical protein